ncbi:hypothetical protein ACRALDRAFT_212047 [Sodiomyces alcalophilus JCM 7366]|uniref:uncharacterized protein n=1 Tax=Sodiomyces alcalophilus JCM 7366 TaxID=591952 RepID=UPI0039B6D405
MAMPRVAKGCFPVTTASSYRCYDQLSASSGRDRRYDRLSVSSLRSIDASSGPSLRSIELSGYKRNTRAVGITKVPQSD